MCVKIGVSVVCVACCGFISLSTAMADQFGWLTNGLKRADIRLCINDGDLPYFDYVNVSESECKDLFARIQKITSLRSLSLRLRYNRQGNPISFGGFASLTNLTEIEIIGCPSRPLSIDTLSSLSCLAISDLTLKDVIFSGENGLSSLRSVTSFCTNSELSMMSVNPSLSELCLHGMVCDGMCDLSRFSALKSLTIANVDCTSIVGLHSMSELEDLTVSCPLALGYPLDVEEDLRHCHKLQRLYLEGGRSGGYYIDFKIVAQMPLRCLSLTCFPIRKVNDLEGSAIEELALIQCPINGLADVCRIPSLKFLNLSNTGITSVDVGEAKKRFPGLKQLEYTDKDGGARLEEWKECELCERHCRAKE